MKAMRAMKKKKVSKIARGKLAKAMVFRGSKEKTVSGLKQSDFIRNCQGKIVSKKASAHAKKVRYQNIKPWIQAIQKARKALGIGRALPRSRKERISTRRPRSFSEMPAKAIAQDVGMSTSFERSCFEGIEWN